MKQKQCSCFNFAVAILLVVLATNLWAKEKTIFDKAESTYNIDKTILVAFAKQESDFNPLAIGVMIRKKEKVLATEACLDIIGTKYKMSKNKRHVAIYPKNPKEINLIFMMLDKLGLDYDLGVMQINRYNIKKRHLNRFKLIYDAEYNIMMGAKILKECSDRFPSNIQYAFECYNKGTDKRRFNKSYSRQILLKYKKLFMDSKN